jgi:RNA polymerase sigma-70 factor (ECF subfamily)
MRSPETVARTAVGGGAGASAVAGDACLDAFAGEVDYLCHVLRRLGVAGADVDDLVQEVFLVFHRRWKDYDRARGVRPWLFGIAYRIATRHQQRRRREVAWLDRDVVDDRPGVEAELAEQQTRRLAMLALGQVALKYRAVLVMHDVDGIPVRDVADALAIPLFTVYTRLRRGRRLFSEMLRSVASERHAR